MNNHPPPDSAAAPNHPYRHSPSVLEDKDDGDDEAGGALDELYACCSPPKRRRGTGDDPTPIDGTNDIRYESVDTKDTLLEVGSPVFAPYPGKAPESEEYYWGRVTKKWRRQGHRQYLFDITFHDGDVLHGMGSHFLHRMREVFSLDIKERLPPPLEYRILWTDNDGPVPPVSAFEADSSSGTLVNMQTQSLEDLFTIRCGKCSQCSRSSCGVCIGCRFNETNRHTPGQICVQTMCLDIQRVNKCQTSPCLPPGWSYYFEERKSNPAYQGLFIFRPKVMISKCYRSYEKAQSSAQIQFKGCNENQRFDFYREVGLSGNREELLPHPTGAIQNEPTHLARINAVPHSLLQLEQGTQSPIAQHPLLGKPFCREWLRDNLRKAVLTGIISGREVIHEEVKFTVEYSQDALSMVLSSAVPGLISPSPQVSTEDAWGGFLCSYQRTLGLQYPESTDKWLVPESASREVVSSYDDQSSAYCGLPVLRLVYNSFYLKLSVKKSSLPDVKFGVFLSVRKAYAMNDLPDELTLKCGELLDLGVYGPLRSEDIKSDDAFLIKSLIHNYKNEVYGWDSCRADIQQSYFDVTDDHTGDLHTKALCRVHPFVNEISDPAKEKQSVVARIDPEGAMHYLLGHSRRPGNPKFDFVFPADGAEREILTDYGEHYEILRLREGYPRKRVTPQNRAKKLLAEEEDYVTALYTRCLSSGILWFVHAYKPMVSSGSNCFSKELVFNVLVMFYFMKQRACLLQASKDPDVPQCGWEPLIAQCHDGIKQGFQLWTRHYGSPEDLFRKARDRESSTLFPCVFSKTNPGNSLDSLDVKSFLELFLEGDIA